MNHILIVDDEVRFRELYTQTLQEAGFATTTAASAEEAMDALQHTRFAMVVSDIRMPGEDGLSLLKRVRREHDTLPFLLVTAYADIRDAVAALKLGAVDYLSKPVDLDELVAAVRDALGITSRGEGYEVPAQELQGMVVESPAMKAIVRDAYRVAKSDAPVLLTGESGVGKEVLAAFIHRTSARHNGPLIPVNCAAIPHNLLASELFGHEKGAFTGATSSRMGRFREAHGGTLFLDEIGDMPLELQPALLRALETGCVTPVGSDVEQAVDYRLIAATNHKLQQEVQAGRFRKDLYYRLNVIALEIPPLRERKEDIIPLARLVLSRSQENKRLSRACSRLLTAYAWPGNIRELVNAMERARLLSHSDIILPEHLPPSIRNNIPQEPQTHNLADASTGEFQTLEEMEIEAIRQALQKTDGNRTKAAELLGITRRGLIYKIKRWEIS